MTIVTVLAEIHFYVISTSLYCAYLSFLRPGSKCLIYIYDASNQNTPHKNLSRICKNNNETSLHAVSAQILARCASAQPQSLNRHSAAAISRPHVTSETMIDSKFFCYIDTVWRLLKDDREERREREREREGEGGRRMKGKVVSEGEGGNSKEKYTV